MGCGCGGASNVYKPPAEPGSAAAKTAPSGSRPGFPAVWNGPKPKTADK